MVLQPVALGRDRTLAFAQASIPGGGSETFYGWSLRFMAGYSFALGGAFQACCPAASRINRVISSG
jgi:hypothetical protein